MWVAGVELRSSSFYSRHITVYLQHPQPFIIYFIYFCVE